MKTTVIFVIVGSCDNMIKNEDEAQAAAAAAAATSNFMHVGSSTRLLSRSPHNNNTLHGEQLVFFSLFILLCKQKQICLTLFCFVIEGQIALD